MSLPGRNKILTASLTASVEDMKNIQIEQKEIKVVSKIVIDGKEYPLHMWNINKAENYLETKEEKYLKELKDFSLDI